MVYASMRMAVLEMAGREGGVEVLKKVCGISLSMFIVVGGFPVELG